LFQPSLGVAQAIGKSGFPARLFFDPCAIVECKLGKFRAVHGVLSYGRVYEFPPVGSAVQTTDVIPLQSVDLLRQGKSEQDAGNSGVSVPALSHPIDSVLHISGDDAFSFVEHAATAK
jgi:hypothetical protein